MNKKTVAISMIIVIGGITSGLSLFLMFSDGPIEYDISTIPDSKPKCKLLPDYDKENSYSTYDCGDYISICENGDTGNEQTYSGCLTLDMPKIAYYKTLETNTLNDTIDNSTGLEDFDIIEGRTQGTEIGYAEPLPHDHVLIYDKIEQILNELKAQRELLESMK